MLVKGAPGRNSSVVCYDSRISSMMAQIKQVGDQTYWSNIISYKHPNNVFSEPITMTQIKNHRCKIE